jgi:hypothetical protein
VSQLCLWNSARTAERIHPASTQRPLATSEDDRLAREWLSTAESENLLRVTFAGPSIPQMSFPLHLYQHQAPTFLDWLNRNSGAIQALSAVVIVLLTGALVLFTRRYVSATNRALTLSGNQVDLQRESLALLAQQIAGQKEEYERDWKPQLRILLHRDNPQDVRLSMVNLGRTAVHVEGIDIKPQSKSPKVKFVSFFRLISVNTSDSINFHNELFFALMEFLGVGSEPYEGEMAVRVRYFSAGKFYDGDWVRFRVWVRARTIEKLQLA